jgi:putative membrane protein
MIRLEALPAINASLNGLAAALLLAGFAFIRARRVAAHRACMLSALAVSALFLSSYLYYHAHAGATRFPGTGALRALYLGILITHTILAAATPPLAIATAYLALRGRIERHRRLARFTLPIWLYVSVTGVIVYGMLYHLPETLRLRG